ncbi:hypothetical protein V6U71_21475 [Sphingopyxis sp. J-6]|uniref:hypothetical protein n=1 Tax=Sphingopyxis sp. J-6 TaxID=3122054 RepID=UPI00398434C2
MAAADEARDTLAWQVGRIVLGDVRSFAALTGKKEVAAAPVQTAVDLRHSIRLWKFALSARG